MMRKMMLLAAGGAGYVLGAKAGRTRYEQIRRGAHAVKEQAPAVKEKVVETASHLRPNHDGDRAVGVPSEQGWPADEAALREDEVSSPR